MTQVVVVGLPESGKTTYLAAFWHLVTSREIEPKLRFGGLRRGDISYLNLIAARWRDAHVQDRTAMTGAKHVDVALLREDGSEVSVTFPDLPGEAYSRLWEDRDCDLSVADVLRGGQIMLFIHANTIRQPRWIVDDAAIYAGMGLTPAVDDPVEWHPSLSPTQVQLVDLLQLLRSDPLDVGPRRIAIMLSAWDRVDAEGLSPQEFLAQRMPLLAQYLASNADGWTFEIYGVSAQGGPYAAVGEAGNTQVEELRSLDQATTRIRLVGTAGSSHDLTEPLAWLMG